MIQNVLEAVPSIIDFIAFFALDARSISGRHSFLCRFPRVLKSPRGIVVFEVLCDADPPRCSIDSQLQCWSFFLQSMAKPGKSGARKLWEGGGPQLWAASSGGRHWKLAYRTDGKHQTMRIGAYPTIGLAEARDRRESAQVLLAKGVNPQVRKKTTHATQAQVVAVTFKIVADLLARARYELSCHGV